MNYASFGRTALVLLALAGGTLAAAAETYPNKPIRFIIPNGAGGLTDIIARMNAEDLFSELGQRIIVENRPSASNILAAQVCSNAAPDGYTICSVNNSVMTLNPALYTKLPYDPETQLKPVILMYIVSDALVVNNDLPVKSVDELKRYALENKGKLNFATLGPGSVPDLFVNWLNRKWETDMQPIAYKSGANASVALMANEVQVTRFGLGNYSNLIRDGRMRFLAGGTKRYPDFSEVPTNDEVGLGDFPFRSFIGIAVPAGTPDVIVDRLQAAFSKIVEHPRYEKFLENHGLELVASTRAEFEEFLVKERKAAKEQITPIGEITQ